MMREPDLEIVVSSSSGYSATGSAPLDKAKDAFNSLAAMLKDAVLPIHQALTDSARAPDELELRLELAFKGEAKWVVVSAGAQATVGLKLVWKK